MSVSKMWGSFQEAVEKTPRTMTKLTGEQAAKLTCLLCGHDEFGEGSKGWGISCLECQWSMSVSAAKPSDGGTRRFSKPFKCFFCNTAIGHDQPYFRLDDPRGRLRQDKKTVMSVYVHANGAKCVGKKPPSGSEECAGCGEADDDVRDVMGAGQAAHMFCHVCKYDKRADLLEEVQTQMERERIAREADATPRKTQHDPDTSRNVKKRRLSLNNDNGDDDDDDEDEDEDEGEQEGEQQPVRASKRRRKVNE